MQHRTVDLAVLGAGAAGMAAALFAARRGLSVAIVDPHFSVPNNLFISGGLFPAAGSALQRAAGIADAPDAWLADLRAFAGAAVNERIAGAVAAALPRLTDCLAAGFAAPLRFLPDMPAPGHRAARFHAVTPASGRALHAWLRQAIAARPAITCCADLPIDAVTRAATGFEIDVGTTRVAAAHLLLAGGGFGGNAALVAEFIPAMRGAIHSGSPTHDGSVMALARGWGAALAGMDGYQGQGHTNPGGATRLGMSLPALGAVMVDRTGRRFVREDLGPSALAARVLACPGGVALEVFDARIEAQLGDHSAYGEARAAGRILAADDVDALAAAAGVPAAALAATLDACARHVAGTPDPLGRRDFAHRLTPPYRASWVTGALAHTQGGVVTDAAARVLDAGDRPIPGLLAAGGCAAGLAGRGGDGYLPGNGLAQSFGLAWLAAEGLARAGGS
ncbi:MAG: FAD-binding protein [Burkholderiales bacterium]|nr:FAD-binding protein [Burkholderiales bacterium]